MDGLTAEVKQFRKILRINARARVFKRRNNKIDADGQHALNDLPQCLAATRQTPQTAIIAMPVGYCALGLN